MQIIKRECWFSFPQALETWAAGTSLKPGQSWFPRMACLGDDGAGEDVQGNEPCPMDLACLFPSARAHKLQTQGVLLQWNYAHCTQRMWSLWAERALKIPMGSMSPGIGVPTSSLLPWGFPTYGWKHPLNSGVKGTGICPGEGGRKKEWDTSLGCFSCHFPLWQSRSRTFPKALVPPVIRVEHKDMLPCDHFLSNFETIADGHLIFTRPMGL